MSSFFNTLAVLIGFLTGSTADFHFLYRKQNRYCDYAHVFKKAPLIRYVKGNTSIEQ